MSYTGRSVDLSIGNITNDPGRQLLAMEFVNSGEVCTGIIKLAFMVLRFLMTKQGTVPSNTSYGSTMMARLESGQIMTATQLAAEFNNAATDAIDFLRVSETNTTPNDEQIGNIELLNYEISLNEASLSFKVISMSGEAREIIIPIATSLGR